MANKPRIIINTDPTKGSWQQPLPLFPQEDANAQPPSNSIHDQALAIVDNIPVEINRQMRMQMWPTVLAEIEELIGADPQDFNFKLMTVADEWVYSNNYIDVDKVERAYGITNDYYWHSYGDALIELKKILQNFGYPLNEESTMGIEEYNDLPDHVRLIYHLIRGVQLVRQRFKPKA